MTVIINKEGRKLDFPDDAFELASHISFLLDLTDSLLLQMQGSASFSQGATRLEKLSAHFADNYDRKVLKAIMTLLKTEPIPFYDGETNQPQNEFDPKSY